VASSAYLTGVRGWREVKINYVFVLLSLHKPLLWVLMFLGHCLDFKLSYEKIFSSYVERNRQKRSEDQNGLSINPSVATFTLSQD
jgi:hypothetical protein